MKRTFLIILALFSIVVCGHAQSLENLGDEAFLMGKYKEAQQYYIEANKLDPSSALSGKISKASKLLYEFDVIDRSIRIKDFKAAKEHIEIVKRTDPGNLWIAERVKALEAEENKQASEERKSKFRQTFKGFYPKNFKFNRDVGLSGSLGVSYSIEEEIPYTVFKATSFFFIDFPLVFDLLIQTDLTSSSAWNHYSYSNLYGLSVGSEYFLSNKWMIDYGAGYMWNKKSALKGAFLRGGITYRFWKDHLGISYMYEHGLSLRSSDFNPIRGHFLMFTVCP